MRADPRHHHPPEPLSDAHRARAHAGRRPLRYAAPALALSATLFAPGTSVGATPRTAAAGLRLPPYREVRLANGLRLLVMERRLVPLVNVELWVEAGAALDPPGKWGLASLTAEALRKGTTDHDAQEFADALALLGASLATSASHLNTVARLELLARDFDAGLDLLAEAVLQPTFPADEVAKLAAQMSDAVVQAKDNPRYVIDSYFRAFLYGEHPLGNPVDGTERSTAALARDDVAAFYGAHYGADRVVLAVAGDIDSDHVVARVKRVFARMPRAKAPRLELPPAPRVDQPRVLLVNKPDTPQTWIQWGGLGPSWQDQDYAAAEIVRTVLGGRFTSWMNTALRVEAGLTYNATWSLLRSKVAGPSRLSTFTATETTQQALDVALAQLNRLHQSGIDAGTLEGARSYLKGQLPYDYETSRDLASALCHLTYFGLGRGFVDDLFPALDAVDSAACRRAIERWFPHRNLVLATVGVADSTREVLARYGQLTERENEADGFR